MTIAFSTPWFSIEAVPDRDGSMDPPYYRLVCGDGVVALPMTADGELVLVEQYRPTLRATTLEFPAGEREAHETEQMAAARETFEETGHVCDFWVSVAPGRMLLNRTDHRDFFVLGIGARRVPGWEPHEATRPMLLSRARFVERVRTDMFEHTAALSALALLEMKFGVRLLVDDPDATRARLAGAGVAVTLEQAVATT
ncbi:MAG: NUDIX hydrolase [Alphaproteobacteria bacterium]